MSFILSCDFWFCCGGANGPELYYYLPPPNMDKPAWSSAPPSHVPFFSKEYNVPQPATQQPPCHSNKPSKAYDLLPQSTQMIPSHVPSTKVHEPVASRPPPQADHSAIQPSNRYQTPSITNQQWAPPIVPPKRPETIVPTLVPMHTPAPAPSKVHNPLQQSKQTALHNDTCDQPPQSHITTQPLPARQPSKTYQNLPSMNQQSMSHVPSKRCDNPVPAVAPMNAHPPVPSKVPAPLPESKKAVPSSVPSTKERDVPPPAQVPSQPPPEAVWLAHQPSKIYQKSPTMGQQLASPPHAPSNRYKTSVEAVAKTKSSKYAELSMESYSIGNTSS
ncbi:hypothetical protein SETIT_2G171300v2 [Setaria italica]|uniref:Uncharacterized protein n=1 Tax=Setaria italica TaxID=4555 RepID=A0A368PZP0_SETIT|nr:hypothetical protein SETIT_2G171300v2 [Setaria italica]